jgi:NADH:ubiquinone oxidoreductase subunit 6 (subunit J)
MVIYQAIIFYILTILTILCALKVIFTQKIFHSVLYAFITLVSVGLIFFLLRLPVLGTLQILIGSLFSIILFIFSIVFIGKKNENKIPVINKFRTWFSSIGLFLILILISCFIKLGHFEHFEQITTFMIPSFKETSEELFLSYGATFVFSSVFFFAVIIGFGVILSMNIGGKK